jgi:hypothetical protein
VEPRQLAHPIPGKTTRTNGTVGEANCATSLQSLFHETKNDAHGQGKHFAKIHKVHLRYRGSAKASSVIGKLRRTEPDIISSRAQNGVTKKDRDRISFTSYSDASPSEREGSKLKSNSGKYPEVERKTDWIAQVTSLRDVGRSWQGEEDGGQRWRNNTEGRPKHRSRERENGSPSLRITYVNCNQNAH